MIRLDRPLGTRLREPVPPPAAVDATWARIQRRRGGRSWRSLFWLVPALAALGLFGVRALQRAIEPDRTQFARADGSSLSAVETANEAHALTFTDGSQISLSAGSAFQPRHLDANEFRSELTRGRALFDVVPHGPRRWVIEAGDVRVSVLGTRFVVDHRAGTVEVEVERGLVEVTGPSVPNGRVRLSASQHVRVAAAPPPPAAAKPAAPPPMAAEPAAPMPTEAVAAPKVVTKPKPKRAKTDELAELLARADEARHAGQPRAAAEAFELAVQRYPRDARSALAAFTLGRLYLDQLAEPERAAEAFERACAFGLPKTLAEEGAARRVESLARAGLKDRARRAASEYLERFPQGVHRGAVEGWVMGR